MNEAVDNPTIPDVMTINEAVELLKELRFDVEDLFRTCLVSDFTGAEVSKHDSLSAETVAEAIVYTFLNAFHRTVEIVPALNDDEYIHDDGRACPWCKSNNITGEEVEIQGARATQYVFCNDCHAVWDDIFELVSYNPID